MHPYLVLRIENMCIATRIVMFNKLDEGDQGGPYQLQEINELHKKIRTLMEMWIDEKMYLIPLHGDSEKKSLACYGL